MWIDPEPILHIAAKKMEVCPTVVGLDPAYHQSEWVDRANQT